MPPKDRPDKASQIDEYGSADPLALSLSDSDRGGTSSEDTTWKLRKRASQSASARSKISSSLSTGKKPQSLRQQLETMSKRAADDDKDEKRERSRKAEKGQDDWRSQGYTRDDPLPVRPGFLIELLLLVLLGVRTRRLQVKLLTDDPQKVWTAFRDSLVKRWTQMSVTSSLLIGATGMLTSTQSADLPKLAWSLNLALTARASALVAVIFGTGLALIFVDANPKDLAKLASRPIHMIFVLSAPTGFAILAMFLFYLSTLAATLVLGHFVAQVAVVGAGVWLVFLGCYCAYLVWLIADKGD